jgi:hypothetical protein
MSGKLGRVTTSSAVKLFLACKVVKYIIVPLIAPSIEGDIETPDSLFDALCDFILDTGHFSSVFFGGREVNSRDSRRCEFNA